MYMCNMRISHLHLHPHHLYLHPHLLQAHAGVLTTPPRLRLIRCPAAKTGSTTIVQLLGGTRILQVGPKASGGLYASTDLTLAEKRAVCERKHFTFTMTRDPFDRLVSTVCRHWAGLQPNHS